MRPSAFDRAAWVGRLAPILLAVAACGGKSGGPEKAQVYGTVTFRSEPVPLGTISFVPADGNGTPATASIEEDGSYTLQTLEEEDGARLGDYLVAVSTRVVEVPASPGDPVPQKKRGDRPPTPAKYENPSLSGLTATVKPGKNQLDFDLK